MPQPFFQPRDLNVEDLFTPFAQILRPPRDKRVGVDSSRQTGRSRTRRPGETNPPQWYRGSMENCGVAKAAHRHPFPLQPFEIHVRHNERLFPTKALRLAKQDAVLGNQTVPAKNHISSRFAGITGTVHVGGKAASGLRTMLA